MANVLIVYAHPEPQSFNAALCARAARALEAAGHDVTVSELYAEGFTPVAGRHLGLEYMGYELEPPSVAYAVPRTDAEGRAAYLEALERRVLDAAAKPVDRSLKIADPLSLVPENAWASAR